MICRFYPKAAEIFWSGIIVMTNLLAQIINGLSVGSIYALVALGYSMVYGIVKLINFAHGDIIMVAAYMMLIGMVMLGVPLWVCILACMVLTAVVGILVERLAYERLLKKGVPRISLLITAIGVSTFLQNLYQVLFGSSARSVPTIIPAGSVQVFGVSISYTMIITIAAMVVMMILLQLFVNRTKMGKAMRAVSEDPGAASLMGINRGKMVAITFAVGSLLAAVGAVLYCATYKQITPFMGSMLGLKCFVAAVLGGIGSIPGAMTGGLIMGVAESLTKGYISSTFADAVVFGILILVLIFRPQGLMGRRVSDKV